jgi:hypothetical protein
MTTELVDFLICDDIRDEMGGKHSFVGVYDGQVNISHKGPRQLAKIPFGFGCWFRIRVEPSDFAADEFELRLIQNGTVERRVRGKIGDMKPMPLMNFYIKGVSVLAADGDTLQAELALRANGKDVAQLRAKYSIAFHVVYNGPKKA